jgi:hypothetical protein
MYKVEFVTIDMDLNQVECNLYIFKFVTLALKKKFLYNIEGLFK